MIDESLLSLNLPTGEFPSAPVRPTNADITEAWQQENRRLRHERGDFARSDTPVDVPFIIVGELLG